MLHASLYNASRTRIIKRRLQATRSQLELFGLWVISDEEAGSEKSRLRALSLSLSLFSYLSPSPGLPAALTWADLSIVLCLSR